MVTMEEKDTGLCAQLFEFTPLSFETGHFLFDHKNIHFNANRMTTNSLSSMQL